VDLFFEIAGDQIDGARDYQEDAFLTTYIDDDSGGDSRSSALVIMADGMGGHAAGNIASNLVASTFNKSFTGEFGKDEAPNILRSSLLISNRALKESVRETPALDGMGCTMVTAALSKGKIFWVSVGDSHLYLIRDRELIKKNEDHSYGGYLDRMKAQGIDVEAEAGLSRNMLMSAMTGDEIAEVDCPDTGFQLLAGDRIIIASDGLDTLSPGAIIQTSTWSSTPKECVRALLKAVDDENKPRQDNTTVIVVDVMEQSAPAPQPVEEIDAAPAPGGVETQPFEVQEVDHPVADEADSGGGKSTLLVGIVVALVLVVGGGVGAFFFLYSGEKPAPVQPSVTQPEPRTAEQPTPASQKPAAPKPQAPSPPPPSTSPAQPSPAQKTMPAAAQPALPKTKINEFTDVLASGGNGPVMVTIPAGSFRMGSGDLSVETDERPQHMVKVSAFAMSKFEVSLKQYEVFAKATGRRMPDNRYLDKGTHPVFSVSWDDAYSYTRWLSQETGQRYRLPSESEWEYAASGGSDGTPFWWGFDQEPNRAHCFGCKTGLNPREPTAIGRFDANQFGLHDTAGNVFEWVHDCYHENYDGAPATGEVWEGGDCSYRVVRGGAYTKPYKSIRIQKRAKFKSQKGYDDIGIRVVRDL